MRAGAASARPRAAPAASAGGGWQGAGPGDLCLLVLQNRSREGVTVTAETRTPKGSSFLDTMTVDLDVGGALTLLACAGHDLHLDCSNGLQKLSLLPSGELRLLPGLGFRQKLVPAGAALPAKYILYADLEDVVASHEHRLPSLEELFRAHPYCAGLRAAASALDALPSQCTVLAPRTLPQELAALEAEALLKHLALPVALFCSERRSGVEHTLDGAAVQVQTLPSGMLVFSIEASATAPAVRLHSNLSPLRCAERFQLVYACE